jgi:Flp pilus assembly protein TadD
MWSTQTEQRVAHAGLEFQARFFGVVAQRYPRDPEALSELGHALTRLQRYEEGLAVDRQLVRMVPENETAHYNLACSLALCGRTDEALDTLAEAMRLGYDDLGHLLTDDDLTSLREEPRFRELTARIRRG